VTERLAPNNLIILTYVPTWPAATGFQYKAVRQK
jgi:hypothetical protein